MTRDGATLQRVGSEGGHWYRIVAGDCFLLSELPCAGKVKVAGKDYECAACGKPIKKGDDHWASVDRRHVDCPKPTRPPTIDDARTLTLYTGATSILKIRAQNELVTFKMNKTARFGVGQGANFLRNTLGLKLGELTGPVDVETIRAALKSAFTETEAMAENLMVAAVEQYEAEGDEILEAGDLWHKTIARYWEQSEIPEDEPLRRAVFSNAAFMEAQGVLLRPAVTPKPGAPTWNPRDYPPQVARVWCEFPMADPATATAGTGDQGAETASHVLLIDHKTREFAKIRAFLAKFKTPRPFHVRPWTSDGCQVAAYKRIIRQGIVGQADRHSLLRAAAKTKPTLCYENYICRTSGESWMLDWQNQRLPWQSPDEKPLHRGPADSLLLFDYLRLSWLRENNYWPATLTGHDVDGTPFPGTMEAMARAAKENT